MEAGEQDQDQGKDKEKSQEETGLISLSKGRTIALLVGHGFGGQNGTK